MLVSAIIVTRGDVDLGPCLKPILEAGINDISIRRDRAGVLERYAQAFRSENSVFYVQDDDCVVDVKAVLAEYDSHFVVCNMPQDRRAEYRDGIALVGWGCVFEKWNLRRAFDQVPGNARDPLFCREADRWFTALNPVKLIDVPFRHLSWAFGEDRMGREARHGEDLKEIRRRIAQYKASREAA